MIKVTFTQYYYRQITREIDIPGTLGDNEIDGWLDENFPKEEVRNAPLIKEDHEFWIEDL